MAARKATTASGRKSRSDAPRSRAAAKARQPEEAVITSNVFTDIVLWLCIAVAGLVVLSLFGIGGIFGKAMGTILFGLFGIMAYIFPFAIVGGAFFAFSNQLNKKIKLKMAAIAVIFILFCTVVELFMHGESPLTPIEAFSDSHLERTGGGFCGAVFAWIFFHVFGTVGAYIVTFVAIIIGAVIVFEKSPLKNFNDRAPERRQRRREFMTDAKEHIARDIDRIERERELRRRHEESRRKSEERRIRNEQNRLAMQKEAERAAAEREKTGQIIEPASFAPPKEAVRSVPLKEGDALYSDNVSEVYAPEYNMNGTAGMTEESVDSRLTPIDTTDYLREPTVVSQEAAFPQAGIPEAAVPVQEPEEQVSLQSIAAMGLQESQQPTAQVSLQSIDTAELQETYSLQDGFEQPVSVAEQYQEVILQAEEMTDLQQPLQPQEDPLSLYEDPEGELPLTDAQLLSRLDFEERTLGTITVEPEPVSEMEEPPFSDAVRMTAEGFENLSAEDPAENTKNNIEEAEILSFERTDTATEQEAAGTRQETASTAAAQQTTAAQPEAESASSADSPKKQPYQFPPLSLLGKADATSKTSQEALQKTSDELKHILSNFGVEVEMEAATCGPTVTRYELKPAVGVKVSKIVNLADDIKLNLAAADIRIEAPIPGKQAVGIEVPNKEPVTVAFGDLMRDIKFRNEKSRIAFAAGRDIGGEIIISDIAKMPHLLIAGATGSGKSVCINTIIMSILYKASPEEVKLIMIDPKVVELSVYNGIPHLLIPVVTDPKKATNALNWAVQEMMKRYETFANIGVRKMEEYNSRIVDGYMQIGEDKVATPRMPQIVIIVDELADLMMVASNEVEDAIVRLTQLARAAGIHLIIATQRPSVNVITGLIKANMPSRIAFSVTSGVDSRTILDMVGAEKLLGKGDMLYYPQSFTKPLRVQGAFVSDKEVADVVAFIKKNNENTTDEAVAAQISEGVTGQGSSAAAAPAEPPKDDKDSYFDAAARLLIDKGKGSIGMLQRYFKVGFNRAARIMDQLAEAGIVGPEVGTKPREVIMTLEEYEALGEKQE